MVNTNQMVQTTSTERPVQTMFDLLWQSRVVSVELSDDNSKVVINEECSAHYEVELNKEQMLQLIKELQEVANKMV